MFRGKFLLLPVGYLLFSVGAAVLLFVASPKSVRAQSSATTENVSDAVVFEHKVQQDSVCLTEEKRAELQEQVQSSIDKLRAEGKLAAINSSAPPQFIFPVRGNGAGAQDYGFHFMGQFVDHNPAFPTQLQDYNCGTRTYDTEAGYNHKGIDIINFPFAWNKMDNNETVAVAAADGQIIFKQDGNFDRSCTWNTTTTWNIVGLLHSDGTRSYYGHLKLNSLTTKAVGEMVTQGEFLGVIGSSGVSTVPHLHFEIYNAANQLQDPYQGPCNLMNNFSYWLAQPAYRDSSINKLMTHSAQPVGQPCPNPTITNEKNVFTPGSQIFVSASYRDLVAGQVSQLSLIQPDGTVNQSWTHVSPNTFNAASLGFPRLLPANAMTGVWKFRVVYESRTYEHTFLVRSTPFDFDGDGKTDISIFRPSVGEWWINKSGGENYAAQFGTSTDKLVAEDYTGDGKTDIAVFRPSTGEWFILRSEDGSYYSFPFGTNGDIPAPADFDADGKADAAVLRPSDSTWYIRRSSDNGTTIQTFGQNGDVPVVADYDGDNKADIAIYRVSSGQWWIQRSTQGLIAFQFGNSTDKPVQGDYTGDGKADVALFRNGEWFVLRSENQSYYSFPFGTNGDTPAPGDYDGDGKFDATVFRPSNNTWYSNRTTAGILTQSFGQTGDVPVPSTFVP